MTTGMKNEKKRQLAPIRKMVRRGRTLLTTTYVGSYFEWTGSTSTMNVSKGDPSGVSFRLIATASLPNRSFIIPRWVAPTIIPEQRVW
jgi:hypothetical protein